MNHSGMEELSLVSYLRLRRIMGILGVALPVVLLVWGCALSGWSFNVQNSISDYYSLRTRDALVGVLFVIAWFLCTYKGYETVDDVAGNLACVFALGVALFPNTGQSWEKIVHFTSATLLFVLLSFFSLCLFTKSRSSPKGWQGALSGFRFGIARAGDSMTPQKKMRNRVYVACGLVMLFCIVLAGLYSLFWENTAISVIKPVFCLESLMIWAFGISWFVKGETLWKDKKTSQGGINQCVYCQDIVTS